MRELTYNGVYSPLAIKDNIDELTDLYKNAFSAPPWKERSICPIGGKTQTCPSMYSPIEVGVLCDDCGQTPVQDAYETEDLHKKFLEETDNSHLLWWLEKTPRGDIIMAALARIATVSGLLSEVLNEEPEIQSWMQQAHYNTDEKVVWVQDIFADTRIRPKGNLKNFGAMCTRLAGNSTNLVMFGTVNPRLISAAQRDFSGAVTIADPAFDQVHGRKKIVSIDL